MLTPFKVLAVGCFVQFAFASFNLRVASFNLRIASFNLQVASSSCLNNEDSEKWTLIRPGIHEGVSLLRRVLCQLDYYLTPRDFCHLGSKIS
ncbi:hypothetical protein L211DRAFT_31150 [Terfezia boudieri ATCC MYA-4762]|uniref:Uncharacterized protein n=1 Tax=Terfezia boudieri ATCC MYA-4762 TaxID=1051890 RepID=A0A3N4M3K4_9PEZI|nr:hypothetical protein L211DRAFT_31150 [Terfezia boudieri ATCC MYA-4762]